jgi:hypothetical protein
MARVLNLDPFNGVYGLPPSTWLSDEMIFNSMPVLEITPCKPDFEAGLNLFSVIEDWDKYSDILGAHGFSTNRPIKAAFIADNFPTDTFTNDYGETFLQKFTDVASMGMSQLAQMTGATSGIEGASNLAGGLVEAGENLGGAMGGALSTAGETAQGAAQSLQKLMNQMQSGKSGKISNMIGGGADIVNKMLGGHRVDFPQVWRNSGFTPSYTATIRLYNPNPGSTASTMKYIVGPLAVFLTLALPRSEDGKAYNWPFFHKIKATGIYNLNPAVITNITIIKGGDQQQISYNQKLGIVDVRLDFASLYTSIILEEGTTTLTNRPTMRSYLKELTEVDTKLYTRRGDLRKLVASRAGVITAEQIQNQVIANDTINLANAAGVAQRQAPKVDETPTGPRVSAVAVAKQEQLESESPNV